MNIMGVVLPVAAVLIAGLLVAALWLWWGGGTPETQEDPDFNSATLSSTTQRQGSFNDGFHVFTSPQTGRPIIQLGQEKYSRLADIPSAEMRNQIKSQIQALQLFISDTPVQKTSPTASSMPTATPSTPEAKPIGAESTMAEQIEIVLQEHLLTLPHMLSRSIHILNSADGGVQIKVDDTYYESVNDVQDNEIKAILQTAIQEWETRSRLI